MDLVNFLVIKMYKLKMVYEKLHNLKCPKKSITLRALPYSVCKTLSLIKND